MNGKRWGWTALAVLSFAASARAQQPAAGGGGAKPPDAQETAKLGTVSNPVSGTLKSFLPR